MKIKHIFIVLFCVMFLLNPVFAMAKSSIFNPLDLKIAAAVKQGYENNVFLNSSRKGDCFTEVAIYAEGDYGLTDKLSAGLEYDFIGLSYHEYTDLNLMNNEGHAFFKYSINDNLTLKAGYTLDSVWYTHDKDGTYFAQGPTAEVDYYVMNDTILKGRYQFRAYDYDKSRIKDGPGNALNTDREDGRHTLTFSIGQYIKELLIKVEERVDFNDSNDEYMDYYDYLSYKTSVFASMPIFKVLYLTGHASYRWKDFESRQNTDLNADETQKTMVLGATAYYNVYKSAYISAGYTYIQNYSNEPINEYSDSITSTGVHIFF